MNKFEAISIIQNHRKNLSVAKNADELNQIVYQGILFIEQLEKEFPEEAPLHDVATALDTVPALLTKLDFYGINIDMLIGALRNNFPKNETIDNALTCYTFKFFVSYFSSIERLRIVEENRNVQMERFWFKLHEKFEKEGLLDS